MQFYQVVLIIAAIIGVFVLVNVLSRLIQNARLKKDLPFSFGLPRDTVEDSLTIDDIAEYWRHRKKEAREAVDDLTWTDLDMDRVFSTVNHTCSSCGEEVLYAMLHEPDTDGSKLGTLEKTLCYFDTHKVERNAVRYYLTRLGKVSSNACVSLFFAPAERTLPFMKWYPLLAVLAVCAIPALIFFHRTGMLFFLFVLFTNTGVFLKTRLSLDVNRGTASYVAAMIQSAQKITSHSADLPGKESVLRSLRPIKNICRFASLLSSGGNGVNDLNFVWEFIKMYFLLDLLAYRHLIRLLGKHRNAFVGVYEQLGYWDAAVAVISYRKSIPQFILPEFAAGNVMDMENVTHPLLKNSVPNTVHFTQNALITGSNASGKSTFIKAVAINAILAQTIHTCLASRFVMPRCSVVTSMAVQDDVVLGESYYVAEVRSLKRVLDGLTPRIPALCFIDEILKGTNTIERIAASASILRALDEKNCLAIVATHDIELTEILASTYANYHFEENITDNGLVFDYRIRQGPAVTKNAIRLLHYMGYEEDIVLRAEQLAENFEKSRAWETL